MRHATTASSRRPRGCSTNRSLSQAYSLASCSNVWFPVSGPGPTIRRPDPDDDGHPSARQRLRALFAARLRAGAFLRVAFFAVDLRAVVRLAAAFLRAGAFLRVAFLRVAFLAVLLRAVLFFLAVVFLAAAFFLRAGARFAVAFFFLAGAFLAVARL